MATKKESSKKQSGNAATANSTKVSAIDKALQAFADMMIKRIEELSAGDNWRKPWFSTSVRMAAPCSIVGRPYNNMNAIFLFWFMEEKGWSTPCFGTFKAFLELNPEGTGREHSICVRKGEQSLPVFYYRMYLIPKGDAPKITEAQYNELSEDEKKNYDKRFSLGTYHVFNIDQTNMKEVAPQLYAKYRAKYVEEPKPLPEGNAFHIPAMDKMIAENLWDCPIKLVSGDKACFRVKADEVQLPLYEQFESGEAFYGTAWHEMTHSTGHPDRLNRLTKAACFGDEAYAFEELIAELSSALIAHHYGIDKSLKDESAKYLKSWLQALKGDVNFIKQAMMEVGKASKLVIDRIEKVADGAAVIPTEPKAAKPAKTQKPKAGAKVDAATAKAKRISDPVKLAKLPADQKFVIDTDEGEVIAIRNSYFERLFSYEKGDFVCKNAGKQFDECDVVLPDECFNEPYDFELIGREIDKFYKKMEAI